MELRTPLEELARSLARAWREGATLPLPEAAAAVASRAEAYVVQDRMAAILAEPVAGWKVGAAIKAVQVLEGHDGPITGRILASRLYASPARVPAALFDGYKIECEFAFRFDRDVPARAGGYARADLVPAITFVPGLEVAGTRYGAGAARKATTHDAIADNGSGGGYVLGAPVGAWQRLDFEHMRIEARIEGGEAVQTYFGDLRRDAVDVLVETVNGLCERGIGFTAGQILSTGSLTMPTPLRRGQTFVARFGDLQTLSVTMA